MKTLKSLKGIEVLDSTKLKNVSGGTGGSASQYRGITATCDGIYADQSGESRTDAFVGGPDGGYWVFGPWNKYSTTSMANFH